MGIQGAWKKILDATFGYCHMPEIPENTVVDVVIDDLSLNIRKVMHGIVSWTDLGKRLRRRVKSVYTQDLKRYVVTFDEPDCVPSAKQPEQRKRKIAEMKKIKPLSAQEMSNIVIDNGIQLEVPQDIFIRRLMLTQETRERLYDFCTAEIASVKFPVSTEEQSVDLIIDGGISNMMKQRDRNNDTKTATENKTRDPCLREGAKYIYVIPRSKKGDRSVASVYDSQKIGEGDLKIPKNISMIRKGNIYIHSYDSDMIPILLLNMRRWIDKTTGYIQYGIFLDATCRFQNTSSQKDGEVLKGNIVDVVSLWRSIIVHFGEHYPGISCPVETVCLLMLLTGGDYAEGFSQLGPRRIWDAFIHGGHKILFENSKTYLASPKSTFESISSVIIDSNYGNCDQRYSLTFNEEKIMTFLTFAYHRYLSPKPSKDSSPDHIPLNLSMDKNREIANARNVGYKSENVKCKIVSDSEIRAIVRRVWWWMDYLMNGVSGRHPYLDPTEMHHQTGDSIQGWETYEEDGKKSVKCAKTVHMYNRPPPL